MGRARAEPSSSSKGTVKLRCKCVPIVDGHEPCTFWIWIVQAEGDSNQAPQCDQGHATGPPEDSGRADGNPGVLATVNTTKELR